MQQNNNYVEEGFELARRMGYQCPELYTLAHFYYQGGLTRAQREILYVLLAPVYAKARECPELALFDHPRELSGELNIGKLPTGHSLELPLSQLATGTLVVGTTGSGKTTLLLAIEDGILSHNRVTGENFGLWVTDHQKADLEAAVAVASNHGFRMGIAPVDLPFNPLEPPPGVPVRVWAARAHAIITFALQLPDITALYFRPVLSQIYSRIPCPMWDDLVQAVRDTEDMPESVRRPLMLKLEGIAADLPGLARVRKGFPIQELERRLVYWPLHRMPRDHARLLWSWARHASYTRRIENRYSRATPDLFVIEDEIAFAYNEDSGNEFISMLCAVQRSTGIAFIGANQTFDLLPQILANTNLKIIGRLASMPDVRQASDLLTLNPEQRDWLLLQPQPGQFLVKMPSMHLRPFPFHAQQVEFQALSNEQRERAERFLHEELAAFVVQEPLTPEPVPTTPISQPNELRGISDDESTLLKNCHEKPFLFHTQRAQACGFNNNRMNRTKKALLKKGWVLEHELETCRPGARPKLLEITREGCEVLGKPLPSWQGRLGGFLHHYGKELARAFYDKQGYVVRVEDALRDGLAVDVLAILGPERVAVEVQVGQDHAEANWAKLKGLVSRAEFLCFSAPVKNRLESLFSGVAEVGVYHFSRYLKELHRF